MPDGTNITLTFPADIQAELINLTDTLERTQQIAENADGKWLGGYVGWDAVAGLLPGMGRAAERNDIPS